MIWQLDGPIGTIHSSLGKYYLLCIITEYDLRFTSWRVKLFPAQKIHHGQSTYPHVRYPHEKESLNKALLREQPWLIIPLIRLCFSCGYLTWGQVDWSLIRSRCFLHLRISVSINHDLPRDKTWKVSPPACCS